MAVIKHGNGRNSKKNMPEWKTRLLGKARVKTKEVSPEIAAQMPEVKRTVAERSFWEVLIKPAHPNTPAD